MKTKILLAAVLISAASLSAHAGVRFGFSFGLPMPIVVMAPAPVYVPAQVYTAPAVVLTTPSCPGPDYVWAPGYWTVSGHSRAWVGGRWNYRPTHVVYGHSYSGHAHGWYR